MKQTHLEKTPIKVLYLEDSEYDIELIQELLTTTSFEVNMDHTDNEKEFRSLLESNTYDIILSDFTLPGFNAFSALELTKKISPNTPFICISGSIGEETAIELIRNGAIDYILKDRTVRLPFAIQHALEITKETKLRQQTQLELKKSNLRFHTLATMAPVGIFQTDIEGNTIYVNPKWCQISGIASCNALGMGWLNAVHPDDREAVQRKWQEAIKLKRAVYKDFRFLLTDGTINWAMAQAIPETNSENQTVGYLGTITDITERKLAEEASRESEQRYKLLLESITDYTYSVEIIDGQPGKTVHGFGCKKVTGYSPEEYLSTPNLWLKMVHPDDKKMVEHYADPLCKGKEVPPLEHRLIHKNGSIIWVRNTYVLKHDSNGKVIGYDGLISDITERRQAEKALQKSEEQYRMLFDQMTSGFALHEVILDDKKQPIDYRFLQANKAFEALTGLDTKSILGKTVKEILPHTEKSFIDIYGRVAISGNAVQFESYSQELNKYFSINAYSPEHGKFATIFEDITKRKLSEDILRENEKKLREAQELAHLGFWLWDVNTGEVNWSDEVYKIFGLEPNTFHPTIESILSFSPWPEDHKRDKELMQRAIDNHSSGSYEQKFLRSDKSIGYYYSTFQGNYSDNGKLISIFGTVLDITERKQMENELRESEERFRMVFENVFDGIALYKEDPDPTKRKIIDCNERYAAMSGRSKNELLRLGNTADLQISLDRNANEQRLKSLEENKSYQGSFSWIRPDSKENIIEYVGMPITWQGEPYSIGIDRDVTERNRAERELRKLFTAVEQSSVSIVITDLLGNIEYINPRITKLTGYTLEEVKGKNPRIWNSGETHVQTYTVLWQTIKAGKEWQGEFHNKKKNGELFWESALISPIKDAQGNITNFLAVKEDITNEKKILFELIEAKEKAEELSRLKSNFMANMSHELRTPLVGLLGISEIMKNELEGEQKENANILFESSNRLLTTITEILNFSKIESEKLTVELSVLNLTQIMDDEIQIYKTVASQKGIDIIKYFTSDVIPIETDERMLKEIIENLLNNALKFTHSGSITVSLEQVENEIIMKFSDTGIGIPKEKIAVIFEPFRQVSEGMSRNFEGTGLGLTIVKNYVNKLNGKIEVESELDIGSTFIIKLPLIQSKVDTLHFIPEDNFTDVEPASSNILPQALIVENDYINSLAIQKMLGKGFNKISVTNGQQAIDIVKTCMFDIILMDINLEYGLNGIEVTKIIRKIHGYERTPIVAVTAYAMPNDQAEFLNSGFSHYLSKPFTKKELLGLVEKALIEKKK